MNTKKHLSSSGAVAIGLVLAGLLGLALAQSAGVLPAEVSRLLGLSAASEDAEERVFVVDVRDGRVPEDLRLIRVTQGDLVTFKWTANQSVVLHLHGYDIEEEAKPGVPAEFAFRASIAGRFPIEAHPKGEDPTTDRPALTYLEVYPR